ncbi:Enoyl-CoA hydratase/carnithine racemase [Salinibacillus kushneri]|uniref:Enoyl-CoA hydratase/carnithine racemase n=1 Tax=Salinibacillus kushneri TaxID=237682 RepID=A0A1I0FQE1_9BACI|nr:enoyl-CoA hydratase/isomerase family protein [Salinibacillus kushneri]SET60382.1 Enoyl-CoA hydratase/carnithine racemase [Salinibacillus kushneri]
MSYQTIEIEKRGKGVTWLTIDYSPVNAIGEELMQDLDQAVEELTTDDSVRVVVITSHHPKIFLAGADLKGMIQNSGDYVEEENGIEKQSARMQACFHRFATMPKPVIAAINGHALGGGCELAMACDFRIMGKGRIGLTEVSLGIIPGAGGTQRMVHLLGRAKATELIFNAKQLEAKEAEEIGLINRAVDPERLEEEAGILAEKMAEGAVHAMGLAKRAMNAADRTITEGLQEEAKAFADTFLTEEPGIGLAAFFQKEKPQFV